VGTNNRPLALVPVLELVARALGATHGTHWLKVKLVDGDPIVLWTEAEGKLTRREMDLVILPLDEAA
jgi:hypothetical protein